MHKRHPLKAACAAALILLPALALAQNASDQLRRQFPEQARRGVLRVTAPPDILLDGKPDRLSPGARIHGTEQRIVMAGQLVGQELPVNYLREGMGLVHEVWLLTPAEQAQHRGGKAERVQRNYRFGSEANPPAN
ncbi:MAG: hypothetical protein RLZZ22_674 [Pseudomonadota bacterium]